MKEVFKETYQYSADGKILPFDKFKLFRDINGGYTKETMFPLSNSREVIIQSAEKLLGEPYPQLSASLYLEYARNGNRIHYEEQYFKRREMLLFFLLAELSERKNRFTDKLLDVIWMILEESTWVLPAHNGHKPHSSIDCPLPYCYGEKVDYSDLFAAETGALLAWVHYLAEDILDSITPVIRKRILYELYRRIITPFFEADQWWTSLAGNGVNNWNPWIVSNMLTVCALCVKDTDERVRFTERAMRMADGFTRHYPDDGGCDEGPNYWTVAGASYFDSLEIIYDMSGGKIDAFSHPFVKKISEYIMYFHITDSYYLNFADSPAKLSMDYRAISRMGRRTKSPELEQFGLSMNKGEIANSYDKPYRSISWKTYRLMKSFFDFPALTDTKPQPGDYALKSLGVMVMRSEKTFLGIKGGHNGEGHNHNDVGNFVVFSKDLPLFIDAGVGTYTADTFNANRYKIWTMRSSYHNLPDICGKEQLPGGGARAVDCVFDTENRFFSAELKNAYGQNTGIASFIRKASMFGSGRILITDSIILEKEGDITFHLLTLYNPVIKDDHMLFPNAAVIINKDMHIETEQIPLKDDKLISVWDTSTLYRTHLSIKNIKSGSFQLEVIPF